MKILFVSPNLEYGGGARQLMILAERLPRDRFELCVCVVGSESPWSRSLATTGVKIKVFDKRRLFQPQPFWKFGKVVREFVPDLIHIWHPTAVRGAAMVRGTNRLVASRALGHEAAGIGWQWIDRWLLASAELLVADTKSEADRYRRAYPRVSKVKVVSPGVVPFPGPVLAREEVDRILMLPPGARFLVCVGPIEVHKGFRDAIWAFDILKYLYPNLHLVIIGDGPDRARLITFAHSIGASNQVHFIGPQPQMSSLLAHGDLVWVPSLQPAGINAALEAMSVGRPVMASWAAGLDEIVLDGETGIFVPAGDKVTIARQTKLLLDDADRSQRMGIAGRERAEKHFSASTMVNAYCNLYEGINCGS